MGSCFRTPRDVSLVSIHGASSNFHSSALDGYRSVSGYLRRNMNYNRRINDKTLPDWEHDSTWENVEYCGEE